MPTLEVERGQARERRERRQVERRRIEGCRVRPQRQAGQRRGTMREPADRVVAIAAVENARMVASHRGRALGVGDRAHRERRRRYEPTVDGDGVAGPPSGAPKRRVRTQVEVGPHAQHARHWQPREIRVADVERGAALADIGRVGVGDHWGDGRSRISRLVLVDGVDRNANRRHRRRRQNDGEVAVTEEVRRHSRRATLAVFPEDTRSVRAKKFSATSVPRQCRRRVCVCVGVFKVAAEKIFRPRPTKTRSVRVARLPRLKNSPTRSMTVGDGGGGDVHTHTWCAIFFLGEARQKSTSRNDVHYRG